MKRKISLGLMSFLYIAAGINHFLNPAFYLKIMPFYLPFPYELLIISGISEIILGILLLVHRTRLAACWLIIAMLIVFLTVHVQMVIDEFSSMGALFWIAILRLPLQFVLIRWAYLLRNTDFKR